MIKIAFGHKARSGKDTACEIIKEYYGGAVHQLSFAKKLYEVQYAVQDVMGWKKEKNPALLQGIGEMMRNIIDKNVWVDKVVDEYERINGAKAVVISDMRYPNEFDKLKKLGFITVRIDRKNRPIDRDPNHPSEISLDNHQYDYVIENNGSIDDFEKKILDLLISLELLKSKD